MDNETGARRQELPVISWLTEAVPQPRLMHRSGAARKRDEDEYCDDAADTIHPPWRRSMFLHGLDHGGSRHLGQDRRLSEGADRQPVAAHALGWDSGRSHLEHFATAEAGDADANGAFWAELKSTGERFEVPEGKTIVAALEEEGIFLPTSCSEGGCGMCVTGLVSGKADHRDAVLSTAEHEANTSITPCCSRALPGGNPGAGSLTGALRQVCPER